MPFVENGRISCLQIRQAFARSIFSTAISVFRGAHYPYRAKTCCPLTSGMASKMEIDDKLNSSLDTLVKQSSDRPSRGGGSGRGRGRGEKRERNENGELWRWVVDVF